MQRPRGLKNLLQAHLQLLGEDFERMKRTASALGL